MTRTMKANAIYRSEADYGAENLMPVGTVNLVVLDADDCVIEVVEAGLSEERLDAIYAGETEYRVALSDGLQYVEVGDGDYFQRLTLR